MVHCNGSFNETLFSQATVHILTHQSEEGQRHWGQWHSSTLTVYFFCHSEIVRKAVSPQKVLSQPGRNATNKAISEATVSDHSTSQEVI